MQEPNDTEVPDLPRNALRRVEADEIVPIEQMGKLLSLLVAESIIGGKPKVSEKERERMEIEGGIAKEDNAFERGILSLGEPSLFTCPECHKEARPVFAVTPATLFRSIVS